MGYKLVVVDGEAKGKVIDIDPPTVIGRSKNANITIGHPLISRRHCEVTIDAEDGSLLVQDLGSLNGTFQGETQLEEKTRLEPGDRFTVGNFTFEAQYGDVDFTPVEKGPADKTEGFDFTLQDTTTNVGEKEEVEEEKEGEEKISEDTEEEVVEFEVQIDEPKTTGMAGSDETTPVPAQSEAKDEQPASGDIDLGWLDDDSKPAAPAEDDLNDFLSDPKD